MSMNNTPFYEGAFEEEDFRIEELLGEGSFAQVYKCTEGRTNTVFALKEFDTTKKEYDKDVVEDEIDIWKDVSHESIVKLYSTFQVGNYLYFVMEYMPEGNLFEHMTQRHKYSEKEAASIMKQVYEALDYLHKRRIIHRDVKPDNLLFKYDSSKERRMIVKLADFGFAVKLPNDQDFCCCAPKGAPMFLAPETILEDPIGRPVDMWSCGVILHLLVVGYPPFWHEKSEKMLLAAVRGQYSLQSSCWRHVSNPCKDLVKSQLTVHACNRITAAETLKHPWINKFSNTVAAQSHRNSMLVPQVLGHKLKSTLKKMHSSMKMQTLGVEKIKGKFFPLHHSAHNLLTLT